jgi:PAS domain S-box-containing protein
VSEPGHKISYMIGDLLAHPFSIPEPSVTKRHFIIPSVVFAVSLLATVWAWNETRTQLLQTDGVRFEREIGRIQRAFRERLLDHEDVLRGAQGLFVANRGSVSRDAWRRYVEILKLGERYPGVQGVGFSLRISPSEKLAHVAKIRREGFPEYTIRPEAERPEYHSIIYIEPFEARNLRAFGYDMFSEPVRRAAMERARDTGLPALSGRVTLVQETDEDIQPGFLMYLPVYREGSMLGTVQERRSALLGFVYSPFRMNDFAKRVLGENVPSVRFKVFDGAATTPDSVLYDYQGSYQDNASGERSGPAFADTRTINYGGHIWTIQFTALPAFGGATDRSQPILVASGGLAASLLLFAITWSLVNTRERALAVANKITAELSDSREQFRAVAETANDAIVTADREGRIVYFNRAATRLFGYSADEATGQPITLLMPAEFHQAHRQGLARFIAGGESKVISKTVELAGRRKDGGEFPLELSLASWSTDKGRFFSGVLRDITERKRAEAEIAAKNRDLEAANRLKSEFLANMSHELRTPLNAIIGFTQLMHDGKLGAVSLDHKEYLGDILTSANHLLQLINDVLDLAKVESGKMEFNPEPVNLGKLVAEVRQILQALAASKRLAIEVEVSPNAEQVTIDPAKLKQVLYNYLSNAIKFTPDEGRITVRALSEEPDYFRLEVEDTGIGIKSDEIGRLFVEFQQLEAGTAKKHQGTGLGLALTKKLVEAQGGRVGVRSIYGRGSVFHALLPKIAEGKIASKTAQLPIAAAAFGAPPLLVIEDNPEDLQWLTKTLSESGYAVDTAKTGEEGIAKAQASGYRAILLDLILPDMGGWDVLHAIRASGLNQNVPVIVVTIVAEKGVARGFPVQDYLVKPIPAESLRESLKRAGVQPFSAKKKVLVVDDDPKALKLARAELQSNGYEVVCHTHGKSALSAAAEADFAAVVLDLLIPEMDGFEFLDRFRQISSYRDTPVVVWTGKDISADDMERLKYSAQSIAVKSRDGIDAVLKELQHYISPRADSTAGLAQAERIADP